MAIIGKPREEVVGKNITDIVPDVKESGRYERHLEVMRTGQPFMIEDFIPHPVFGDRHFILKSFRAGGGLGVIASDITERKQAEEALARQALDLERSNAELEQFAYVTSHDLREPLRVMSSYLELLERRYGDLLDERGHRFIAHAVDGAARMHELINGLLAYSRVGTQGKELEPVDCETVLKQAEDDLKVAIEESGAEITHDPLPTVMADELQLRQVFQNLIDNAIKFHGEEPPQVHIAARRDEGQRVFSVRDKGIGVDPEQAKRLFEVFQRLHTWEEYSGVGIGLAICKKIVERHGGRIWVESEPGQGATFYFTLPDRGDAS